MALKMTPLFALTQVRRHGQSKASTGGPTARASAATMPKVRVALGRRHTGGAASEEQPPIRCHVADKPDPISEAELIGQPPHGRGAAAPPASAQGTAQPVRATR